MDINKLYFIKDIYYEKFSNYFVSFNKNDELGDSHNRPCYYSFSDGDILWMVPISSQVNKYKKEYKKSINKYGVCDSLSFVYIKGNENVALIQNMIPVTQQYVDNLYTYHNTNIPVEINEKKKREINGKVRKALRFAQMGKPLTFTPILEMKKQLLKELKKDVTN